MLPTAGREDVVVKPTRGSKLIIKQNNVNDGANVASKNSVTFDPRVIVNFNVKPNKCVCRYDSCDCGEFEIECECGIEEYEIYEGMPLRTNKLICDPIENIKHCRTGSLIDPSTFDGPDKVGTDNPVITFNSNSNNVIIDDTAGMFEDPGGDDYTMVPHIDSTRYGRLHEVLELSIQNVLGSSHPFHLHGFSIQPCKIETIKGDYPNVSVDKLLYEWDYNEFVDVINVPPGHRITFRIKTEDKIRRDRTWGGGIGRWLFHCHIVHRVANGMISEFVIVDDKKFAKCNCYCKRQMHQ